MKKINLQELRIYLDTYKNGNRNPGHALGLADCLVGCGFNFLDAKPAQEAVSETVEGIEYPTAQFSLGGVKFAGKCLRCSKEYNVGDKMFWVKGKGCFCPEDCSDLEHRFYKDAKAKFYYNYLFKLGMSKSENALRII